MSLRAERGGHKAASQTGNVQTPTPYRGGITSDRRFRKGFPCPICGGTEDNQRGDGSRCFGFLSEDGEWAHCTRSDHAGLSPLNPGSNAHPHRLKGKCPCGTEHAPADPPPKKTRAGLGTVEAVYRYCDAAGQVVMEAVRYRDPKAFRQRRPTPEGKWVWNLSGVDLVPYRLPELLAAPGRAVLVVEGEKDVDALRSRGFVATCNPMGAGKWRPEYSEHLAGRHVAILPDNDQPGRDHGERVARSLHGKAASVKVVELPGLLEHGDVSDYFAAGGTADALKRLIKKARPWSPPAGADKRADAETDRRPVIIITTEEHEVIDQAVAALSADPTVFQRGFMLTTVQRDTVPAQGIIRPPGTPRICTLPLPRLRERLTKFAAWKKWRKGNGGGSEIVPAHPPEWAIAATAVRGEWPTIRPLEAVIESPVMRHDGSILDAPGYDQFTGLLYEPNAEFPPVKAEPTHDDARAAAALLLDLVVDFPFTSDPHRAAWLAGLLTPLARFAIDGPCPLFLIDAPASGSGKSLLADVISVIRSGREMTRKDYPDCNEEIRKTITAIALAGDPVVLIDNVATAFGGSALDAALTGRTWKDRILGVSQMTPDLPLITVWFATGNNVALKGDIMRRIIPCRLVPDVERPEERTEFKHPDLIAHARRQRPELVAAALTILRAYVVAGRPDQKLTPLGGYGAWSGVVRAAVVWSTGVDPCGARGDLRAADDAAENSAVVVAGWAELPDATGKGYTAAQALKLLKESPDKFTALRDAVMWWSRNDELPTQKSVGQRLKILRGKVMGGMYLHSQVYKGTQIWSVRTPKSGGIGGNGGICSWPRVKKTEDLEEEEISWDGTQRSHHSHQSHQTCGGCLHLDCPECNRESD